uniref:hypothetical protein n=1 Tax=Analipus japonicus TaxID=31333 RepID=UPI002E75D426|nr:hypothetical protein V2471_pgp081 [Analipus japonicus]WAM61916.1 hypothetical protein [Analipus japonicus]
MLNNNLKFHRFLGEMNTVSIEKYITEKITCSEKDLLSPSKKNLNGIDHNNGNAVDNEVPVIYKKYKNKANVSESHKKLNKTKVYLIVKSIEINGKQTMVAVPINNFDDLSNSTYGNALSSRVGTFQMRTEQDLDNRGLLEGRPGNRPFILEHAIKCREPYQSIRDFPLEELMVEDGGNIEHLSSEEKELLEISRLKVRIISYKDFNDIDRFYYYYLTQYEYDQTFVDNTIFTSVKPYLTDPRDRSNFNQTIKDKFNNLKNSRLSDFWSREKKQLRVLEFEDLIYKNTDELLSKNIIPVFCTLEEAQDLLLTILEEILEPFKKYIPIYQDSDSLPIINLDYIEDSFNFKNRQPVLTTKKEKLIDWLVKYRLVKSVTNRDSHYVDYAAKHTRGGEFEEYGDINYFDFDDEWEFEQENKIINYIFDDYKRDIVEFDELLLNTAGKTKIVSMGLGDFLDFWNNTLVKNGEVLFIPGSKNLGQRKLPFFSKKPTDRFYDYQQKFRNKNIQELDDYTYEIKKLSKEN